MEDIATVNLLTGKDRFVRNCINDVFLNILKGALNLNFLNLTKNKKKFCL